MDNQTIIANAALQLKFQSLLVDFTEYPVNGPGTDDGVQWTDEVPTVLANIPVAIITYLSITNYPHCTGYLIRVHYTFNFQIKAASATADVTWQLQARNKDGDWVNMSEATLETNLGTSYVTRAVSGYMEIQAGANAMPFEMRLIIKSNESNVPVMESVTWAMDEDIAMSNMYCMKIFTVNSTPRLYSGGGESGTCIRYTTGGASWTSQTLTGVHTCWALEEFGSALYAATNGKVFKESSGTWSAVSGSQSNTRCFALFDSKLWNGNAAGYVYYSADGAAWTSAGQPSGGASQVNALAVLGSTLYAGCENGNVYKFNSGTSWSEVGNLSGATAVNSLAVLDISDTDVLFAATDPGKVYKFDGTSTWTDTNLSADLCYNLFVYDGTLFAGTGYSANVYYYDVSGNSWTETGDVGETRCWCFADFDDTIWCGTGSNGKLMKGTVVAPHGEATGKVKNDSVIIVAGRLN